VIGYIGRARPPEENHNGRAKGLGCFLSSAGDKFRVWDSYWQDSRLYSAGADDPQIAATLDHYWTMAVRRLTVGAAVLDVACGNGAAGLALSLGAKALKGSVAVTGIDEAMIDPPRYLPDKAEALSEITFRAHTAMENLPLADASFDAVISQFGFEFGIVPEALKEAARVLKPGGYMTILALPAHSHAAQTAKKAVKQARYLLRDATLFADAFSMVQAFHDTPEDKREERMRIDLERFNLEVEKTVRQFDVGETDVVFAIIIGLNKVFIDRKTTTREQQIMALETVRTGLAQYAARAQSMVKAAMNDVSLDMLKRTIANSGFKLTETRTLLAPGQGSIAWQLSAERLAPR
jgi:ubiquinone/menaquinone biosynthesis C-methylase UbiE